MVGGLSLLPHVAQAATFTTVLESNTDLAAGSEVFALSYNTFDDLIDNTFSHLGFSQLDVGQNFSIGGVAYDGFPAEVAPVPLPASLSMSLAAVSSITLLTFGQRRRSEKGR